MQAVRNTAHFAGLGRCESVDSVRLCKRAGGSPVGRASSAITPKVWEHSISSAVHLVFVVPMLTVVCLLHLEPGLQCRSLPKLGLPLPFSLSVCSRMCSLF